MTGHMPLVKALEQYAALNAARFHMPGHKGGEGFTAGFVSNLASMDVSEIPGLDNLHQAQGVIREAQELTAQAFGADYSHFLVNGSTCGIYAMIMAACPPGSSLLVPRNCHKAVWGAMVLGDITPVYIEPELDEERLLVTQVSLGQIRRALDKNPDVVGMILVHPSYYGLCADIEAIAGLLHSRGKFLLVDEAHGAHFPFSLKLPPSAGEAGADLWVQSAHKTLPAFTQAAYLHGRKGRINPLRVAEMLKITQSTSPSYILMASLDWARNFMVSRGEKRLEWLVEQLYDIRTRFNRDFSIECLDAGCRPEVKYQDPTRLVIEVADLGMTGYRAEEILRDEGLQVEMSDLGRIVLICTVADDRDSLEKIVQGCQALAEKRRPPLHKGQLMSFSREIPRMAMSPRQAFYSISESIPLQLSRGRISSGLVGAYPPGIPRYCPGEIIEQEGIEELLAVQRLGGSLFGVEAGCLVNVVKDPT